MTVGGAEVALRKALIATGARPTRRRSRACRGRIPDQRERLRPDRAAAATARHRRRPARLRARAGVLPFRRADDDRAGACRCSCPRRSATRRSSCPTRSPATASRSRLNTTDVACASRTARSSSISSATTTTARWRSTRSWPASAACPTSSGWTSRRQASSTTRRGHPRRRFPADDQPAHLRRRRRVPRAPVHPHRGGLGAHRRRRTRCASGRRRLSALTIPWCTYTDPRSRTSACTCARRASEIPVKTFTVPMHDVDRAITDGEERGFVKIHVRERTRPDPRRDDRRAPRRRDDQRDHAGDGRQDRPVARSRA